MKRIYCGIWGLVLFTMISSVPLTYAQQRSTVSPFGPPADAASAGKNGFESEKFARTELYFGTSRAGGSAVTEEEFDAFLDGFITPRFPEGLTLITGLGQFLGSSGPIQEVSKLLILLYPERLRKANNAKIEEIRDTYKSMFQQEAVLRSDRCCEKVGF